MHCESVSIIVQQDATMYSFFKFLQTALHISDDTLIHHQEHTQTVITTTGTGRTIFATKVANTVRPVPDVGIKI